MSNEKIPLSRRQFIASTALGAAAAATGTIAMPSVLRAAGTPIKIGVLQPVTGPLSYSGTQGQLGAMLAIEEINAAGGIKALGGAHLDPVTGDVVLIGRPPDRRGSAGRPGPRRTPSRRR